MKYSTTILRVKYLTLTSWVILGVLIKRSRDKPRGRRSSREFGSVDRRVSNYGTKYFWPLEAFGLVNFGYDGGRSGTVTMEDEMDWSIDRAPEAKILCGGLGRKGLRELHDRILCLKNLVHSCF